MKIFLMTLLGLHLLGGAWAQVPERYDPVVAEREQVRINEARNKTRAEFDQEDALCYQRFAVNDCLKEVRKRRRARLEELRRQEIVLNDQRRAHVAEQRRQRVEEKAAQRASPQEALQKQQAERAHEERIERARQKQSEAQQRKSSVDQQKEVPASSNDAASTPAAAANAARAARQREYEDKVRRAEERQSEREQEKAQSGQRSSRPLPVPP